MSMIDISSFGLTDASSSSTSASSCRRFTLAEIQSATNNFDDELIIGQGGFGKVYKSQISTEEFGHVVAIKRLDCMSNQGASEFRAEIVMLSKLRHCNLVSLIGYCDDNKEMILVYEYMPNGTLYDHLHKDGIPLTWVQRLKMAIGAGSGLDYLHTCFGTHQGVIHRDIKSSNILLNENWDAMLSDFGLSKIGPINQSFVDASVKGTFGYLDPEYFYTRKLTVKTDVYAFGVVLFELLSGRPAVDEHREDEQCSLVRWAQKCMKERKLDQMVDPTIHGTISNKFLRLFAQIAYRCLLSVPKERPAMFEVVGTFQALLDQQENSVVSDKSPSPTVMEKINKYLVNATKQNTGKRPPKIPKPPTFKRPLLGYDELGATFSTKNNDENSMNNGPLKDDNDYGEMAHQHGISMARDLKRFTYGELELATMKFGDSTYLGMGMNGPVHEGWVNKKTYSPCKPYTGLQVAVKRLSLYNDFNPELLKDLCNPNLVKLIGYCLENEELFLVHESMLNGNFKDLLVGGALAQLPLAAKVRMALGIARGIVFMRETQFSSSHPNLLRQKIYIDKDFTAKLSFYKVTGLSTGRTYLFGNSHLNKDKHVVSHPFQLLLDLSGFSVVLAEILLGKQICNENELSKINKSFIAYGKEPLDVVSKLCFEICNEVDSNLRMVKILEDYDYLIHRSRLKEKGVEVCNELFCSEDSGPP